MAAFLGMGVCLKLGSPRSLCVLSHIPGPRTVPLAADWDNVFLKFARSCLGGLTPEQKAREPRPNSYAPNLLYPPPSP